MQETKQQVRPEKFTIRYVVWRVARHRMERKNLIQAAPTPFNFLYRQEYDPLILSETAGIRYNTIT